MKLFFEVLAMNPQGHLNFASIGFDAMKSAMISDFTDQDVIGQLPEEFIGKVKCIMLVGEMNLFCCEDRITLMRRVEKEYAESFLATQVVTADLNDGEQFEHGE